MYTLLTKNNVSLEIRKFVICIFCEKPSGQSISTEHIIPESLGNIDYILPAGIVCDDCNNYFARKVEKEVLDSGYFRSLRFVQCIPNKKNNFPTQKVVLPPNIEADFRITKDGHNELWVPSEHWDKIENRQINKMIIPFSGKKPGQKIMSRFLAKIAVEAMVQYLLNDTKSMGDFLTDEQLIPVKKWARYGRGTNNWPFHERNIYNEDMLHPFEEGDYQVVHEYGFLCTPHGEIYCCIVIFGNEYTINMGGPEIEGYLSWLNENNQVSPLYKEKHDRQVSRLKTSRIITPHPFI